MPHPIKSKGRGKGGGKSSKGKRGKGTGGNGGGGDGGGSGGQREVRGENPSGPSQVKVDLRLARMKQHLLLNSLNYLDDESRKNAFLVMAWSRDNYLKRQAVLIEQVANQEKMKQEKLRQDEKVVGEAGGENGSVEATPNAEKEHATAVDEVSDSDAPGEDDKKDDGEIASGAVEATSNAGTELLTIADGVTISKDDPRILPLLSAPIDAETLLARLNNRRLYARIMHYKRDQRKKVRHFHDEDMDGFGSVKEDDYQTVQDALKDQRTADRLYRKNLTIDEMADLEWDELLELANMRMRGEEDPYYPVPTQHELLLFSECPREVGVLASYPRSGNSLMRTLYEHTTLRVTGSDMQGGLAKHDLVGECAVDSNFVQFVKTHYPERQGNPQFRASRVVLLVRNPFDAIESYFNLMMTGKHTDTITPEIREKTVKYWEEYVLKEIKVWKLFHTWWLDQDVPLLLIRYEDLVRWPDKVMGRVLQFVLEVKRMHTFFDERISRCISDQQEIERMGSYKPRSGGIGKSLSKYSPELFAKLKADSELRKVMGYLEYTELLEKPPDQWDSLKPLDDYAHEHAASWEGSTTLRKVVLCNDPGRLVRTKNENTPWQQIKKDLGLLGDDCNCAKCTAERQLKKAGGSKNASVDNAPARNEEEKMASSTKVEVDANEKQTETDGDNSTVAIEDKKENRDINHCTEHMSTHEPMHVKNNREKKERGLFDFAGKMNLDSLTKAINTEWDENMKVSN